MRELYVYYRLAAVDAGRCEAIVHSFQVQLMRDEPRLRARLLGRPALEGGDETWMETYALEAARSTIADTPSPGIDAALEARIAAEAEALGPYLRGPRHVEVFVAKR